MTDPNTQTPPTDPQDLIDQALSGATPPPTPETTTDPAATATPTIAEPAPLPTPEPLTPSEPPKTPEPALEPTPEPTPEPAVMPSELVKPEESVVEAPQAMPSTEPAISTKASNESKPEEMVQPQIKMGEDVPLAFAANAPTVEPVVASETVVPPAEVPPANVPPAIVGSMTSAEPTPTQKPKKKGLKMVGIVAGAFLLLGVIGVAAYNVLGQTGTIAYITKFIKIGDVTVKNPAWEKLQETGSGVDPHTGETVTVSENKTQRDKDLGIGEFAPDPKIDGASNAGACGAAGGFWCENYGFCMKSDGSQGGCNNRALELGYAVTYGANWSSTPKNGYFKRCSCYGQTRYFDKEGVCGGGDTNDKEGYSDDTLSKGLCSITDLAPTDDGIADRINEGVGGSNYCSGMFDTSGGCQDPGVPPNSKCFCGTIQIDKPGQGFESVTMKCGCDKEAKESAPPTITTNPTLMCESLIRTPTTAPKIGDTLTFTCAGASTPAGAVSLTYKFRYSLNSGAYISLNNKTATTAELMIASCGNYKVQCQACGTINGTLTCDPTWSAATQ